MHAVASECKTIILAYSKQVKSWFKIPPNKSYSQYITSIAN